MLDSNAAFVGDSKFLGKKLDDEWFMTANSSVNGTIEFYNTTNISTSSGSFVYVDVCTTGNEPTLWITENYEGSMTPSTKWYKVNMRCNVNGYQADVYRQIIFVSSSKYNDKCQFPNASSSGASEIVPCTTNSAKGTFFTNTNYNTYIRLLHFGISDSVPLNDLVYDNDLTQTDVLKEILETLKSSNNNDVTGAINNQTQKIEDQIKKQEETNNKLDDLNNSINSDDDDTSSKKCGLVCKLKGIFTGIIELPGKLIGLLIDALKSLFIPSDDFFENFITDFKDHFLGKLGFLAFPFELIGDVLGRYMNISSDPVIRIPNIYEPFTGGLLIESTSVNLKEIFEYGSIGTMYVIYRSCVSVLIIVMFLNFAIKKYDEFVKNKGSGD